MEQRRIGKRIAAWLLCLAMVLTTIHLPAFTTEVKAADDGYDMRFYYGDKASSIRGGTKNELSTILGTLGITGDISSAESSNSEYFEVTEEEGVWYITSKMAYDTETLKVTVDEKEYSIWTNCLPDSMAVVIRGSVYFDPNGGSGSMGDASEPDKNGLWEQSVTYGDGRAFVLPECGFIAPSNMEFEGWEIDGKLYVAGYPYVISLSSNRKIKAIWKEIEIEPVEGSATFTDPTSGLSETITWSELKEEENGTKYKYNAAAITDTEIGDSAFKSCTSLTDITLADSVTSIGASAFVDCYKLKNIAISNSVTSIGDLAFEACKALKSVTIPKGVTHIGHGIFAASRDLVELKVDENNSIYTSRDESGNECNAIIEKETKTLTMAIKGSVIPSEITAIGVYAYRNILIKSFTFPNSIARIEDMAFVGCSELTSITIPANVTSIGAETFRNCIYLKEIIIENPTISLGTDVFKYCNRLETIVLNCKNENVGEGKEEYWTGKYVTDYQNKVKVSHNFSNDTCQGVCVDCGAENIAGSHNFVSSDISSGMHICSDCSATDNHTFASYIPDDNATCAADGTKTAKCSYCDATDIITDEGTATGEHEFLEQVRSDVENQCIQKESCTQSGEYYKVCAVCHTLSDETFEVAKLSHQLEIVAGSAKTPTCIEKGKEADKKCKNCTYVETGKNITAKGHTVVTDEAIAPTCDKPGKTEGSHCSVCNIVLKAQNTVPATEKHSWDGGKVTKKATLKVAGKKVFTCKDCGKTNEEIIAKLKSQKITVDKAVSKKVTLKAKKLTKNKTYNIKAKAKTSVSYKVTKTPKKAGKYISVSKKGAITLKKKAPKGTYEITVTAKETAIYGAATKKITIVVK